MKGILSRLFGSTSRPARKTRRPFLGVEALEDRLTPSNVFVSVNGSPSTQQKFNEYTPAGQLVRSVVIPPGAAQQDARDMIVDANGDVLVFNGTGNPYLSTYSNSIWSHRTHPTWSTNGPNIGGIALAGDRVFVTDITTISDSTKGLVWFDRNGGSGRITTTYTPWDVNLGKDGLLYAMDNYGLISVYNPQTLALQRTLTIPLYINGTAQFYTGLAVNAAGQIFVSTSTNATVHRFSSTGVLQGSQNLGTSYGALIDIDVSGDGGLLIGTSWGYVVQMSESFTNFSSFWTGGYYYAFVTYAGEPAGPPSLRILDSGVTEGNSGSTIANFTVTLSSAMTTPVVVDFATADSTATAGVDYLPASGTLFFDPGETSKTIAVTVLGDTQIEDHETFFVNLVAASGAPITDGQATGTISNDDIPPALTVNDRTVTEGSSGTVNAVFTVSLSGPTTQTVSVGYSTLASSASAGVDYQTTSGTLAFAAGEVSKTVSVPVIGDVIDEFTEYFYLSLASPVNATIADYYGLATILDDDTSTLSINDISVSEGNSDSTTATFTISLSTPSASTVSVNWATANGTAVSGSDYTAASSGVSFAAGQTSKTITVTVAGDTLIEPNETFVVNLSGASNATISDSQGVATIVNDDLDSLVSINDASVSEGNSGTTNINFTVYLSAALSTAVSVDWSTADGSALAGSDYSAASGTVTFAAGETSRVVTVAVLGDGLVETPETFTVNLSGASGVTIGDGNAVGTIQNDDLPLVSVNDISVTEGNSGSVTATFTITLSQPSWQWADANYNIVNNGASNGVDYSATTPGTVSFAPGETSKTVSVTVYGDTVDENNEAFNLVIYGAGNAGFGDTTGVATIVDDDDALFSVNDVSITEGHTGTTTATFTISLSTTSDRQYWVNWATSDWTATAGSDYNAASGTVLTFNPGQTSRTVTVTVRGDNLNEVNETFDVNLSGGVNAGFADAQGVGTIVDDDALPIASINDVSVTEGNSGGVNAVFTVSLHRASTDHVTIDWGTSYGTAGTSDYTPNSGMLVFAPGEITKTVSVEVLGDPFDEPNETFFVNLSNPTNAAIGDSQGTGTILDDDEPPRLAIGDVTVTEGNSGTTPTAFTVTLTGYALGTVTVNWTTANSSAVAGSDYVAASGALTFLQGETTKTITVDVVGDTVSEPNELFFVNLSNPVNATFQDSGAAGYITNDDLPDGISILDTTVTEGDSGSVNATFSVILSSPQSGTVTVNWKTWASGTAAVDADYAHSSGTLTFAPGETAQSVTVPVHADVIDEVDETFRVYLSNATGMAIGRSQATATIYDNDPTATRISKGATAKIAIDSNGDGVFDSLANSDSNGYLNIANFDTTPVEYRTIMEFWGNGVTPSTVGSVTLDFYETSFTSGSGYGEGSVEIYGYAGNGSVTMADATAASVFLGAYDADVDTGTHSVSLDRAGLLSLFNSGSWIGLQLVGVSNVSTSIDSPSGFKPPMLVFHTHAAPPATTVSVADVSVLEGTGSGYTDVVFTLTLSQASTVPVTVTWKTADGTAQAGSDYVAGKGFVVFNPGETQKTVTVRVYQDSLSEVDETFGLQLQKVSNATIAFGNALASILNDDL